MFLIVIIQIVFRGVGVVGAGVGELELIVVTLRRFLALMVHVGEVQLGGEAALPGHSLSQLTNKRTVLGHMLSVLTNERNALDHVIRIDQ